MAQCPVCQVENADDFGLVNCVSCGSPFFIDIDGGVSQEASPAPPEEVSPPPPLEPDSQSTQDSELANAPVETPFNEWAGGAPGFESLTEPLLAPQDTPATSEPEPLAEPPTRPLEDLREIADFGNSDASLAREGAYRFTVHIRGIDTAEIRHEIRHQLSDSRFLWDIDALLESVKDGELVLADLSAVKAALAVQRLKVLPVEISWEQHAIHQTH